MNADAPVLVIVPRNPRTDPPEEDTPVLAAFSKHEMLIVTLDADGYWWEAVTFERLLGVPNWWVVIPVDEGLTVGMMADAAAALCTWAGIKQMYFQEDPTEQNEAANIIRKSVGLEGL